MATLLPTFVGNTDAYDIPAKSAYKKYNVDNVHTISPGLLILPVASETAETVTVRVHGGFEKRTVSFDIAKQGNPPVIPLPADTELDTLVNSEVNVITPSPDETTGGYNWTVKGQYEYVTTGTIRKFGVDQLPVTGYPFMNPRQDIVAAQSLSQGGDTITLEANLVQAQVVAQGGWLWPFTIYPSNMLMNPNLIS